MHSQDPKTRHVKHILEEDFFSEDISEYILNISKSVRTLLSSPESALLLNEIYDEHYNLTTGEPAEELIGSNLYRERESFETLTKYSLLVQAYIKLDIKKFFNLNIEEFLNLTTYARNVLIKHAKDEAKAIAEAAEEMTSELSENTLDLTEGLGLLDD